MFMLDTTHPLDFCENRTHTIFKIIQSCPNYCLCYTFNSSFFQQIFLRKKKSIIFLVFQPKMSIDLTLDSDDDVQAAPADLRPSQLINLSELNSNSDASNPSAQVSNLSNNQALFDHIQMELNQLMENDELAG